MRARFRLVILMLALLAGPALAQDSAEPARGDGPTLGAVTNLPLPRFVSLKADEANVRRGPSLSHRVDWIFTRRDMPLQVTAEYGNWRRVVDRDGLGGWVHYVMLSGNRTVIVDEDHMILRSRATSDSAAVAELESGVIAAILSCGTDWCEVKASGYKGWAPKASLWGVGRNEIIE